MTKQLLLHVFHLEEEVKLQIQDSTVFEGLKDKARDPIELEKFQRMASSWKHTLNTQFLPYLLDLFPKEDIGVEEIQSCLTPHLLRLPGAHIVLYELEQGPVRNVEKNGT